MLRTLTAAAALSFATAPAFAEIIEIASFKLAEGVTAEAFAPVDKRVADEHVSKQPGFISRETGVSDGEWVVIVHWESSEDAAASMESFASAPAAAKFMSMADASTMKMVTYEMNK